MCLHDHIAPRLPDPREQRNGTDARMVVGYRTLCPAHDDGEHSLSVSVGEHQRIVWQCFACGKDETLRVRAALIRVYGVSRECLPVSRKDEGALVDAIEAVLCSPTKEDTLVRLQALALVRGCRQVPKGAELLRLASDIGIGRSQAFDAARRLRASSANTVPTGSRQAGSSTQRSARRVAGKAKSGNPDSVREPGLQKSGNPDLLPEAS